MYKIKYILFLALLAGCDDTTPPKQVTSINNSQDIAENSQQQTKSVPVIVTIVSKHIVPNKKRGLDVRLEKKITKEALADVAVKIKNADKNKYERTFITYYLPNMEVGAGAWASTHFNPNLEVSILGLSIEDEKLLRDIPNNPAHKIVGSWLEEPLQRRTTIYTKDGKTFISHVYIDGSSWISELVEKNIDNKRTFHKTEENSFNEYYFIDKNYDLNVSDGTDSMLIGKNIE
jgi:hypothetical protein